MTSIYQGFVTDNGGATPRPADQIVYSVAIDYGGNVGVVTYSNITPNGDRPDPAVVDAIPRRVGYPFLASGTVPGAPLIVWFEEVAAYGPCNPPAPFAGGRRTTNSLEAGQ